MALARRHLALLKEHDLEVTGIRRSKHFVVTVEHAGTGRTGVLVFPVTSSDWRATQNLAREMRKISLAGKPEKRKE